MCPEQLLQPEQRPRMPQRCPACFTPCAGPLCQTCGEPAIPVAVPGGADLVIGHVGILEDASPRPEALLEARCTGLRRWPPYGPPGRAWAACRRHGLDSVWIWKRLAHELPNPFDAMEEDSREAISMARLYRALAATQGLILEFPPNTRSFMGSYERFRSQDPRAPEWEQIVPTVMGRMQSLAEKNLLPMQTLVLTGDPTVALELKEWSGRVRRWERGPSVLVAGSVEEALSKLLKKTRTREAGTENMEEEPAEEPRGALEIVDLGGSLGRTLLFRLHLATHLAASGPLAVPDGPEGNTLAVRYPIPWYSRVLAGVSLEGAVPKKEGLARGRMAAMLHGIFHASLPGSQDDLARAFRKLPESPWVGSGIVPPWTGLFSTRRWDPFFTVDFGLHDPKKAGPPAAVLLVAVGSDRSLGARALARLIEHDPGVRPVLVGHDQASDRGLLGQVLDCYPSATSLNLGKDPLKAAAFCAAHVPAPLRDLWEMKTWN
ncbi:MAG: hypothetical protein KKA60_08910 [Proteobacteria bacterium]|nr:hypothetical protein [Pseudomonadota bacterium]